jgi:hypothetical protein
LAAKVPTSITETDEYFNGIDDAAKAIRESVAPKEPGK